MKKIVTTITAIALSLTSACGIGCNTLTKRDVSELEVYINNGQYFNGAKKDSVWQEIEKKANVKFSITGESHSGSYYTKLSPLMNTIVDAPDIVFIVPTSESLGTSTFNDVWCSEKNGLVYSFEELLAGYEEGTYPYLEKMIYQSQYKNLMQNGKHYLLPNITSANSWGIYYRTDWLIAAGYYTETGGVKAVKYPTNMDEFTDVLEKFSKINTLASEQGITLKQTANKTYGFSSASGVHSWMPIYHAFGVTPDWDIYGDSIDYMYTNEKYRNFLEWANGVYNRGYVYPTFNSLAANGERQLFYDGQIGVMFTNAETHVKYIMDRMTSLGVGDSVGFGPAIEGTEKIGEKGSKGFSNWGGYWGGFCISKACQNTKGALSLLNFLLSPEGMELRTNGIEGVHYTKVDGKVTLTAENIENRMLEGDVFTAFENKDGEIFPTGDYILGGYFGSVFSWDNFDITKEVSREVNAYALDQKYTTLVQQALDNMVLKSSKLVNFTSFSTSTASAMNAYEDLAKSYVNSVIIGANGYSISEWDSLVAKLKNTNRYKAMFASANETCKTYGFLN